MREDELADTRALYNLGHRLGKEEALKLVKEMDAEDLVKEITDPDGLGHIFYEQIQHGSQIFTDELIKWIHTEKKGTEFIAELNTIF